MVSQGKTVVVLIPVKCVLGKGNPPKVAGTNIAVGGVGGRISRTESNKLSVPEAGRKQGPYW